MVYVALLRGINVGGNNKIDMKQLKAAFESVGMHSVKTYINSGNVVFAHASTDVISLTNTLEKAIQATFGLSIKVLLRDIENIRNICKNLPELWQNNADMKCDVMFLWESHDSENILSELTIKPDIDEVKYVSGAIVWRVDTDLVTRSGLLKVIGTNLYKHMTVRNCNTTRKLLVLMEAADLST